MVKKSIWFWKKGSRKTRAFWMTSSVRKSGTCSQHSDVKISATTQQRSVNYGRKLYAIWSIKRKNTRLLENCKAFNVTINLLFRIYSGWWATTSTLENKTFIPLFVSSKSSCCRSRELVSFVRQRETWRFDARHVTRSLPIENGISAGDKTLNFVLLNLYSYFVFWLLVLSLRCSITHLLTNSLLQWHSLFVCSFGRLLLRSLVPPFVRCFVHLFGRSFVGRSVGWLVRSFLRSVGRLFYIFRRSFIYLNWSLIHSFFLFSLSMRHLHPRLQ